MRRVSADLDPRTGRRPGVQETHPVRRRRARALRGHVTGPPEVEVPVVLDLLDAACSAGASVPRAVMAVGGAIGGDRGASLRRAGSSLLLGAAWDEAWSDAPAALRPVAASLRSAWEDGVAPGAGLRAAAEAARRDRHARAAEAAGRLGVRLVLPLGLCHLPAFLLVGLMPVLVSMASGVLGG